MKLGLHEAFRKLGTKSRNKISAWAAISEDKQVVAVTAWQDDWEIENGVVVFKHDGAESGEGGWKERTGYLSHAVENLNSRVRVIMLEPHSPRSEVSARRIKSIARIYDEWFLVENFDPPTGLYTLRMAT